MPDTNYNLLKMMIERWNAHDLEYSYRLLADHYREHLNGVLVTNGRADARARRTGRPQAARPV